MSTWNVYKVAYVFSPTRNLYALFVATDGETDGTTMLVYGDLQQGMRVQVLGHDNPETIRGYIGKELIGTMNNTKLQDVVSVAQNMPAPWKQLDSMGRKLRPDRPWYRGEDWFNEVVDTLKRWDLLTT